MGLKEITRVGQSVAVGSCGRRSIMGLDFEGVGSLLFTIEYYFGEDLTGLLVNFEIVLALIPGRVYDPVINLFQ